MSIKKTPFGKDDSGREVFLFTITNASGAQVAVTNFGATLVSVRVPDKNGTLANVALGFDRLETYKVKNGSVGATIGRVGNRIAGGRFSLNGKEYALYVNNGANTLHGGKVGFDKKTWDYEIKESENAVAFAYVSPDMEEGFPGALSVSVTYTWTEDDRLSLAYRAETDKDTIVNLTNHSYFNLAGEGSVFDHTLQILADRFTEADAALIPTGKLPPVDGTPFDMRQPARVGDRLSQLDAHPMLAQANGFDLNYVLPGDGMRLCAVLAHPASGREMRVYTDQPGIQCYSGQGLNVTGHGGARYTAYSGLALETQHYPDAPHHDNFPSIVLKKGETLQTETVYAFGVIG